MASFEAALQLDPEALGLRPAARAAHDASRPGKGGPERTPAGALDWKPTTETAPTVTPRPRPLSLVSRRRLREEGLARPEPPRLAPGTDGHGGVAAGPGPPQRLGARRARGVLEIRGAAAAHRGEPRVFSLRGQQLVRASGGRISRTAPSRPTSPPWSANIAALREAVEALRARDLARKAAGKQVHDRPAHPRRGRPRPVSRRTDPVPEAAALAPLARAPLRPGGQDAHEPPEGTDARATRTRSRTKARQEGKRSRWSLASAPRRTRSTAGGSRRPVTLTRADGSRTMLSRRRPMVKPGKGRTPVSISKATTARE